MPLLSFGFTRTQDAVFWALVRRGSATGYAIARDTGIARANVYHALEVLAKRGLASVSGGHPSIYRATEAGGVLRLLSAEAARELAGLARHLGVAEEDALPAPQLSTSPGELRDRTDVIRETSQVIATAGHEILAVVGPWVPELGPLLSDARGRGVGVRVVSLGTPAPEGAIVRDVPRTELEAYWGGLPVAIVADRRGALCCVLAPDGAPGIATSNPGIVPFLRHLLRRELAGAALPRVS
jgi:HTH-type transcriptional regulator, sugar sensing transcriptional regulator